MNWTTAEQRLADLGAALEQGEPAGAYLCCAQLLEALMAACYIEMGQEPPSPAELFSHLPETRLGRQYLINFEAYVRICYRLDNVRPGRKADEFPQYTDAERLISRMRQN